MADEEKKYLFQSNDNLLYPQKTFQVLKSSAKKIKTRSSSEENDKVNPLKIKEEILGMLDEHLSITKINKFQKDYSLIELLLTPDEKYAITSGYSDIIIFDLERQTISSILPKTHTGFILKLLLTRDGKTLISCAKDNSILFWDLTTKKVKSKIESVHTGMIQTIFLTNDNKYIVSTGAEVPSQTYEIKIWDISSETKNCIGSVEKPHDNHIYSVSVTKDNKYLLSISGDKNIKIWSFGTWNLIHCFQKAHTSHITHMWLSEDDKYIYTGCQDGSIGIWDISQRKHVHTFANAHGGTVFGLCLSQDGHLLFSCTHETLVVWDTQKKAQLYTFSKFSEAIHRLAITKNNRYIYATGSKGTLFKIELENHEGFCFLSEAHEKLIDDVKITSDDKYMITGADDSKLCIWDFSSKKLIQSFEKPAPIEFWASSISPDDKRVVTSCSDGLVEMWSIEEKKHLFTYETKHFGGATCVTFTHGGSKVISACHSGSIIVREAHSPKTIQQLLRAHQGQIKCLAVTKDDKYIISGGNDRAINIFETLTLKKAYTFENAHDSIVHKIKITDCGRYIISGSGDGKIKVWDLQTCKNTYSLTSIHKGIVREIQTSQDGNYIFTIDYNCNIEVHNLKTKKQVFFFSSLAGEKSTGASFNSKKDRFFFIRGNSIHSIPNPFNKLNVQLSEEEFFPFSHVRFMPIISFFLNNISAHRQKIIESFPSLQIHPHCWNWLHIAAIFSPNKENISACLANDIPYTTDAYGKTPLHYLLEEDDINVPLVSLILSKWETIMKNEQSPFDLLSAHSDIFCKLLSLESPQIQNLLKFYVQDPEPETGSIVDVFGAVKSVYGKKFFPSESRLYSQKVRETLISDNSKQKITIKTLPIVWDYSLASKDMNLFVRTLSEVNSQEVFEAPVISNIIEYLWRRSKKIYCVLGIISSIYAILISIYTGYGDKNLAFELPIFLLSMFFLIYELFEFVAGGFSEHYKSVWNYVDTFGTLLVPATIIAVWADADDEVKQWLFSFVLVFAYLKWLSYFRIFDQTRGLIRMIVEILKDIRSFVAILAFITFGLSLIFLQFDRDTPYDTHLLNSYKLLYSDFDLDDTITGTRFFLLIVIALVCIVLLNMLIAIMGETYGKVQEKSVIVDSKEVLEMSLEIMKIHRIFDQLMQKQRIHARIKNKKYMFIAEEKLEEEQQQSINDNLEESVNLLREKLDATNHRIDCLQNSIDQILHEVINFKSKSEEKS